MKNVVYVIENSVNGNVYVGSAVDAKKREREHWRDLRAGKHKNVYLQNAWNKYGPDAFSFKIVEQATRETLIAVEQKWIDAHQGNRYNICPTAGSSLGTKQSEETKQKRAASLRGRKRVFTDEWKQNMSKAVRNCKPLSEEHKQQIALSNTGKKRSPETCAKLRAAWERRREKSTT